MRKLGIDYGETWYGIAITDLLAKISSPRQNYKSKGWKEDILFFCALAKNENVDTFVIGLPMNMDGTEGERCAVVRAFAKRLENESGLPVVFIDERLTTVEMDAFLESQGISPKNRKQYVDKLSAQLILKTYLDQLEFEQNKAKKGE